MKTIWIALAITVLSELVWADSVKIPRPEKATVEVPPSKVDDPLRMVFVQGGTFQMGREDEIMARPAHSVTVDSYKMQVCEVTRTEFERVMSWVLRNEKIQEKDDGTLVIAGTRTPLISGVCRRGRAPKDAPCLVTWYGAAAYCNFRSEMEGLTPCYKTGSFRRWASDRTANGYRLPTEAEWEYAARGGKDGRPTAYSGSNNPSEVGWYKENSGKSQKVTYKTTCSIGRYCTGCQECDGTEEKYVWALSKQNIGSKQPNELGLYDLSGNLAEWCNDWYGDYSNREQINPTGPSKGREAVVRGGEYSLSHYLNRVFDRRSSSREGWAGFRVVQSVFPED